PVVRPEAGSVLPHLFHAPLSTLAANATNCHGEKASAPAGVPPRFPPGNQPRLQPGQAIPREAPLQEARPPGRPRPGPRQDVPVAEIFYSNPMKSRPYLEYAAAKGVEWYVVDSVEEIRKVQSVKADAKLYLRIDAPNIGSDWPLAGKFGAHMHDVPEMIQAAVECKADLAG